MADVRTDPGEFYPGGRTLAKAGTAAAQADVVRWNEVSGRPAVASIEAVGASYRLPELKDKINEILAAFKNAAK